MAKDAQAQADNQKGDQPRGDQPGDSEARGDDTRPGGAGGRGMDEKLLADDPKNRLKTAELQLERFEKNRYNKDVQEELGYDQAQYDRFLESYREMVSRQRERVAAADEQPKTPAGPPTITVGGSGKVEARGTPAGTIGSVGPSAAPPGFADATRRFGEEAARLRRGAPPPGN